MQTATRTAIELHAAAIQVWAITDVEAAPTVVASRVTTARLMSEHAISHTTNNRETSAIVAEIDAACTDAETEAAIQAHAAMIVALVMADRA
jgi:formate-dependent phosphoribosylglycinamide formyltransferase (GAR transformylase)